ncbi:MAG: bacteriophage holin [Elusimicrobiales bacterium]
MNKLNERAFALSLGIVWGASIFLLGLINIFCGWGNGIAQAMSTFYIGYKPTFAGSIVGGIWGFADAGIGGLLVAWLYNKFSGASE